MYSQVMKWREETDIQLRDVLLGNASRVVALNNNMEERIECYGMKTTLKQTARFYIVIQQLAIRLFTAKGVFVCLFVLLNYDAIGLLLKTPSGNDVRLL